MTIYPAILLLIALGVCSGGLAPFIVRNNLQQRYKQELRMLADQPEAIDCNSPNITENWFEQKYDQFNQTDTRTYQQHYFVNWKFHDNQTNSAQPVVFLQIGGEGEIPKRWVCLENYTYMVLAKENNAIVVQLEHRFFGKNLNMTDLSTSNLQYLTTEQALADIAAFIPAFSEANKLVNPRWVAFGGSYPGSLAAWLRIKYPNLTVGNVASSAPLWPKVNFWEYSDVMEKTIKSTSEECYKNVGDAFKELKKMTLTDKGRSKLSQMFHIYPPLKDVPDDITNFYGEVFNVFQGLIQYTYDARTSATLNGLNISQACNIMNENESSLVKRLADVMDWDENLESEGLRDQKSLDVRYQEGLKDIRNVSLDGPQASMRGWMWLSCNEFGWLQTTDKGNSLFGDIISIGSYYKLCMDTFGPPITSDYIEKQVAKAQQFFGNPSDYNVSNVILPNGAFDPWSVLGTSVSIPDQHQIAIMTPGAAHCSDMYAAYDGEPIRLSETRKRVMEEVNYYLRSGLETQKTNSDSFNGAETLTYSKTITGVILFLLITIIN